MLCQSCAMRTYTAPPPRTTHHCVPSRRHPHARYTHFRRTQQVDRLGASLGVPGDVGYTAETAEYFRLYHVQSRIEEFRARFKVPEPPTMESVLEAVAAANPGGSSSGSSNAAALAGARVAYRAATTAALASVDSPAAVADAFPFPKYFATAPGGLEGLFHRK